MPTFRPDVDICDCGALVLIVADVPGAAPDAIDASFDDGVLSVRPPVAARPCSLPIDPPLRTGDPR